MSLRTYTLISHPLFLDFVEREKFAGRQGNFFLRAGHEPPSLNRVSDLAHYLDVNPKVIVAILKNKDDHYRSFTFQKKGGGTREIDAPRTFLKVVQWWIKDTILDHVNVSKFSHGFTHDRSFVTNAQVHFGAAHLLNIDIRDFFPSISDSRAKNLFSNFGYSEKVAEGLANLTTLNGRLPQGAPTSPSIANQIMSPLDDVISQYAESLNLKYSRYADDITLSGSDRIGTDVLERITNLLLVHGFKLNEEKTRFMGPNDRKEVTGLVLGRDGPVLSREYLNSLRGWYHSISHHPADNLENVERVRGTISLLRQVGGRGTGKLIDAGLRSLDALEAAKAETAI